MASLQRIVLFDMLGDELFSGRSMLSEPPMPKVEVERQYEDEIESCPETLRSSVFVRMHDGIMDANASNTDDGEVDVTFSERTPEIDASSSGDINIREDESSEIRATPASLGRVSEPEISVEMIDSLFDDHAA